MKFMILMKATAESEAVDGSDQRHGQTRQVVQHPVQRLEEVGPVDATQIGARAERRPLARHDDDAGTVGDRGVGGGVDGTTELEVEGVATILALQLDDDDVAAGVT